MTILCLASCSKPGNETTPDPFASGYFVFGHFYGECFGEECIEIFKIESGKLYEAAVDIYPLALAQNNEPYPGDYQLQDGSLFEIAAGLQEDIPDELFLEIDRVLGMPDAGDWGGIYIEYFDGLSLRKWAIDTADENIPAYLHTFNDRVLQTIYDINN